MSLIDLIYLSQKSLRSNILRSVLTSLGIIIGVSSVITMISIGSGARQEVEEQIFEGLPEDKIKCFLRVVRSGSPFKLNDYFYRIKC